MFTSYVTDILFSSKKKIIDQSDSTEPWDEIGVVSYAL
jgi:hypothetical protein